ncbi:MAG: TIR domain-containing protein [Ktedonobacteraceae bacterium]|nr:TIR domain-containing protein [Ktedonobacteraceae bacterium]
MLSIASKESIEIFFCYAREDEELRQGLEKQLRSLRRQGIIDLWHDRKIAPGDDWENEIDTHLNSADIILLLISPDFMDSDYCYGKEMIRAMERHNGGEARVIPIILRHVYWQGSPFGKIQALPTDGIPVIDPGWHRLDIAFYNVAEGIRVVAEAFAEKRVIAKAEEEAKKVTEQNNISEANDKRVQAVFHIIAADKTDAGKQCGHNEDFVYRRIESADDGDHGLFIVADGMSGDKVGEIASKLTVETISKTLDFFFKPLHDQPTYKLEFEGKKIYDVQRAIKDQLSLAIQQANRAIVRYSEQKSVARGLGSTVTVALIQNGKHVLPGEWMSPCYCDIEAVLPQLESMKRVRPIHSLIRPDHDIKILANRSIDRGPGFSSIIKGNYLHFELRIGIADGVPYI